MDALFVTYRNDTGKITVARATEAWFQEGGKLVVFKPVDNGRLQVLRASVMVTITASDPEAMEAALPAHEATPSSSL
jgi:hypothetical protein